MQSDNEETLGGFHYPEHRAWGAPACGEFLQACRLPRLPLPLLTILPETAESKLRSP
jgi:hypothetical protein